ncbi:MAG: phosphate signaling complex protein PhoU [Thermoplasmata archaeon]|nr:phosphate signaling complex protein PhoU [Thermoplasmata archaeon]
MSPATERKALSEGLDKLRENMTTLAELASLAIRKATEVLEGEGAPDATAVFTLDQEIFALREETVKSCVDLIALHAPVARDLRRITTSLEITTDLDRIGRYSRDIVEAATRLQAVPRNTPLKLPKLHRMSELTIQMVDTAIRAFVDSNAEPVRNIIQADDAVDSLHDQVFLDVVDQMADRTMESQVGAQYILINRYMERIADHAVNIGQHVTYMVTGRRPWRPSSPKSES